MAGSALFEVRGGVISGFTRSVTERLVNTSEAGLNSDSFGMILWKVLDWNGITILLTSSFAKSTVTARLQLQVT